MLYFTKILCYFYINMPNIILAFVHNAQRKYFTFVDNNILKRRFWLCVKYFGVLSQ